MNTYIKAFIIGASVFGLTACNDYLDQQPEDKLIPETFFNQVSNMQAYTLNLYTMLPSHSDAGYELGTFSSDNGTDNQASRDYSARWTPGEWRVGENTQNWNFEDIRKLNYFFEYAQPLFDAEKISGDPAVIKQTMGEAHFLLAYAYWKQYQNLGDYPIIDGVLPNDREALLAASARQPRNKVARYILDHLKTAIELLPENSTYGKNGINKASAQLFRGRVALFEGTWLKYHKGTAFVPGGKDWPGDKNLLGADFNIDNEINYFLTEAMASSKEVADVYVNQLVENTGTTEGMGEGFEELNPYYCMFCVPDPSKYSEVLMYRGYNVTTGPTTQIQAQYQKNAGGTGWTRSLVNSFVMSNGLPIYDANSGYDANWEDQGITATLQNRDSRIQVFTKQDGSIITYGLDGKSPIEMLMYWVFERGGERTMLPTGYAVKKGQGYDYNEAQGNLQSYTGSITFRAVEALLNYIEASVEKTGAVDQDADKYWRAIRKRAKIDEDYTKTVNATVMQKEAELGDWGAYSHNQLVGALVYNVRRERRNELIGEGLRLMDVRRWAALDQMATTPYIVEGMKYWGTVYNDANSPLGIKNSAGDYVAPVVNITDGTGNMSPKENSLYIRPYQVTKINNLVFDGYKFTPAHYLAPIGYKAFVEASTDKNEVETSIIYQNPGWPVKANEGAILRANE